MNEVNVPTDVHTDVAVPSDKHAALGTIATILAHNILFLLMNCGRILLHVRMKARPDLVMALRFRMPRSMD